MSHVRLVVCDVDGTLVDKKKRVTDASVEAVGRLAAAGIGFTIISARPRSGMLPVADRLGLDGEMAAFNGGTIFRRDGTVVSHHTIDETAARGVVAQARETGVDTWVFANDQWFASDGQGPHTTSERITADQEPVVRADFADLLDHADKITFVSDDEAALAELARAMADRWSERATVAQSQTYYLDVTALDANKGAGIAALADARGVPLEATAAIGDQANDLPMLERAGLAIAMGNAPDAVKKAADGATRGNDADGVAYAIDTMILDRSGQ